MYTLYERFSLHIDKKKYSRKEKLKRRAANEQTNSLFKNMKRHRQSPHLNLAFQHLWIQAPYCSIEWKQPDHQFSEEHALQHTGTKPDHTK